MKLKVAVIGLGRMGAEPSSRLRGKIPDGWLPISHIEAIRETPEFELVAICDQNDELLRRHQEYYGINKGYVDYREMITEIKPDIISIATRTDIRCEIIKYGLQNNVKGFYAEKPISRSLKDCKEILNIIQHRNSKIIYGATRRAMDIYKKAKDICDSGELGQVKHISVEFGSTSLLWSHPHSTDLIIFFSGSTDVTEIQGSCFIETGSIKSPTLVDFDPIVKNAHFTFANGVSASISQASGFNVRIACESGILTIHGDGYCIEINRVKDLPGYFHSIEEVKIVSTKSGTQYLMEDLRDAVLKDQPVKHIVPDEILCGQRLLFGILESSMQGGRIVTIEELNENVVITGRSGKLYA
jgi:scyllo-inositol 2-dehydrogenase (NAD+)